MGRFFNMFEDKVEEKRSEVRIEEEVDVVLSDEELLSKVGGFL